MKAKKKNLVGERADMFLRRFDQGEADIARRIFDPGKITRHFPARRQDDDRARMRELPGRFIIGEAITNTLREARDRVFVAREKMPAIGRPAPARSA